MDDRTIEELANKHLACIEESYEDTGVFAFARAIADLQREEICSIADHLAYNEYRTPSEVHVLEELTTKIRATKGEGE